MVYENKDIVFDYYFLLISKLILVMTFSMSYKYNIL